MRLFYANMQLLHFGDLTVASCNNKHTFPINVSMLFLQIVFDVLSASTRFHYYFQAFYIWFLRFNKIGQTSAVFRDKAEIKLFQYVLFPREKEIGYMIKDDRKRKTVQFTDMNFSWRYRVPFIRRENLRWERAIDEFNLQCVFYIKPNTEVFFKR